MPILHLMLKNGDGVHRDDGHDYRSVDDALKEAGLAGSQMLSDDLTGGRPAVRIKVSVERPDGATIAIVTITAAVARYETGSDDQANGFT